MPRPAHFPDDPRLERLVDNYDCAIGSFKLSMKRRNARDLRKGIFGPEGGRNVPDRDGGEMEFPLPEGWTLRLTYHETFGVQAGKVDAEFIPPVSLEAASIPQEAAIAQRKRPEADSWLARE